MKRCTLILLGAVAAVGIAAPVAANDDPRSAAAAAQFTNLLDERKLEAFATRDPEQPGRFLAALYIPGSQLLVVSAPYPVPTILEKKIAEGQYMEVYIDIQSARSRDGHFFVMDAGANGLRRISDREEPFDSTSRNGTTDLSLDGNWEGQKLTEADYDARFREDDVRYTRMLTVLARMLVGVTSTED